MKQPVKRTVKPFEFFANFGGISQQKGLMVMQPNEAELIENLHVSHIGEWTAYQQGYDHHTAQLESGATLDALTPYRDDTGANYLLAVLNGKVLHIDELTGTVQATLSTAFSVGEAVDFCVFAGSLYATAPSLNPQKWSGSGTMTAASGFPLVVGSTTYEHPGYAEVFNNRMAYAHFNGTTPFKSHLALSDDLAPETITIGTADTDGAVIGIAPGDGQHIRGLRTFSLPNSGSEILLIWKDESMYALEGATPSTFRLYTVNKSIGALNNRCIVRLGSDVVFLDRHNVHSLSTVSDSATIQPKAIGSERVQDTLADLNLSALETAWAQHLPDRHEVWFAIPTGAALVPDTILVYCYKPMDGAPINAWSVRKGTTQTCGATLNKTFFTGDASGYVNRWFGSSSYAGMGYVWKYQLPFYPFETQNQNKRIVRLDALLRFSQNTQLTLEYAWQGGGNNTSRTLSQTVSVGAGNGPIALYGTALYNEAVYSGTRDGVLKKIHIPVLGNGERFQIGISGISGDTAPSFLGFKGFVSYLGQSRQYL
ncbi:MAG: hypothetical protein R2857_14395 [Vampirovibrionales bacterium]